jgi:hypothetical protein
MRHKTKRPITDSARILAGFVCPFGRMALAPINLCQRHFAEGTHNISAAMTEVFMDFSCQYRDDAYFAASARTA